MILFDLDGTLLDTAPDLGLALNIQLARHGFSELAPDVIRPYASHGSKGLLKLGFGIESEDPGFDALRLEYLDIYNEVFKKSPKFFEGMDEVLDRIEENKISWGIVTNKPRRFSQPLVEALNLNTRFACLVCGDDAQRPKPFPDTLLLACQNASVNPSECYYVGDAERDILAGVSAGMETIVALYGYISKDESPSNWGASYFINSPNEILSILGINDSNN